MDGILRFLNFVTRSPEKRIIQILTKNDKLIQIICEILLNILLKNIKVDRNIINKLKKYKRVIYKLIDKRTSLRQRRQLLLKTWPIIKILSPLIPLIIKSFKNEPLFKNVPNHRSRQKNT